MKKTIYQQLHKEKILFWLLAMVITAFFILYMFLVNGAIQNVVAREEIENNLATLNAEVSELEFEYIALKNSITIQYAYERGFEEAENITFARRGAGSNLSFNPSE